MGLAARSALSSTPPLPTRAFAGKVAGLPGKDYSSPQMSYDLRRLRLHGLIERQARTNSTP